MNEQLEQSLEKHMGLWKCKICDKTAKSKNNLKKHIETHIEGLDYTCNKCTKTFATSISLSTHVSNIHNSKLYSCKVCGTVNMNRMNVYNHKKRCNGSPEEQKEVD